jgi:hypothetical protein
MEPLLTTDNARIRSTVRARARGLIQPTKQAHGPYRRPYSSCPPGCPPPCFSYPLEVAYSPDRGATQLVVQGPSQTLAVFFSATAFMQ